jgi:hypothetical protein
MLLTTASLSPEQDSRLSSSNLRVAVPGTPVLPFLLVIFVVARLVVDANLCTAYPVIGVTQQVPGSLLVAKSEASVTYDIAQILIRSRNMK